MGQKSSDILIRKPNWKHSKKAFLAVFSSTNNDEESSFYQASLLVPEEEGNQLFKGVLLQQPRLFQENVKTIPLVGWERRIAYFVSYWSRPTKNKEILQMVKRLKLQFLGETSRNKPFNRDQNISQRKNFCTKRNLGFVEERSNNTYSKFKGSVCQQHHSKMVSWKIVSYT